MDVLTDAQRFPLLTEDARRALEALRQHPFAPPWNHRCGDRLTAEGLARVRLYARALERTPVTWRPGEPPAWVYPFAARALATVPLHRARAARAEADPPRDAHGFASLPTTSRADLAAAPWRLVPDDCSLDDLIVYDTSGRTGHPIVVPTHPETSSMYLPLLRAALKTRGVTLDEGPDRVTIVNVCKQRSTFTFACVSSFLGWAGCAKVNLDPADWRDPDDRVRFLDACDPQIYTGDPLAFAELSQLPLATKPRGLVSTSMAMLDGLKTHLEEHFACPLIDLYSLTESGPVAVATPDGHRILPHDLYVEVTDEAGRPCAEGERGEVTLTGGRNPFLPLLRYRTGDWASLVSVGGRPHLIGLEGRAPLAFRDTSGRAFNNVDVTNAMRPLELAAHTLHQHVDGRVTVGIGAGSAEPGTVLAALRPLFGDDARIEVAELGEGDLRGGKVVQYSSDIG